MLERNPLWPTPRNTFVALFCFDIDKCQGGDPDEDRGGYLYICRCCKVLCLCFTEGGGEKFAAGTNGCQGHLAKKAETNRRIEK